MQKAGDLLCAIGICCGQENLWASIAASRPHDGNRGADEAETVFRFEIKEVKA